MKGNSVTNSSSELKDDSFEPYVGPRPFTRNKKDQSRFFGRGNETDRIRSLIFAHRLVLIYAQSGAGKTSIFNAQVIPSLEQSGFSILPIARVKMASKIQMESNSKTDFKVSDISNIYIFNALQSLNNTIEPDSILNKSLIEFLNEQFPPTKDERGDLMPQILIFDQFEELFNLVIDDRWIEQREDFFNQISHALIDNHLLRIVFVIREDYVTQLDPFREILPEKLRARFRLERLREDEAIEAIKGPLTRISLDEDEIKNLEIEIGELVKDLLKIHVEDPAGALRQVEGEYVEPIQLQVVCRRWWREREQASKSLESKRIKLEQWANVDVALEDFYDEAILSASKQTGIHEKEIRNWCQQKLITSTGTRSIVHRGLKSTTGMDNKVVDILEAKYLIRREWRSGALWYELTHDRLIKPITISNTKLKSETSRKTRNLVLPRMEEEIHWLSLKARQNKFRFRVSQIIILTAGAIILIVNVVNYSDQFPRIISSVIGVLVVAVIGINQSAKYEEGWMSYRAIAELLKKERYLFENDAAEYSNLDEAEKNQLLFERYEYMTRESLRRI
jgi:Protein of unknown function (DUF4231)